MMQSYSQSINNSPLVSIVIPCHNSISTLKKTVDSALGQTYKHIEILLIDDGSKDGTWEFCQELASQHSEVFAIQIPPCLVSASRNAGWNNAKGDYIAFLDSDDVWFFEKLQFQMNLILNNRIDLFSCETTISQNYDQTQVLTESKINFVTLKQNLIRNHFHTSETMIKRDLPFRFDESIGHSEDWFLWNSVLSAKKYRCAFSKTIVAYYLEIPGKKGLANNFKEAYWKGEYVVLKKMRVQKKISGISYCFFFLWSFFKYSLRRLTGKRLFLHRRVS